MADPATVSQISTWVQAFAGPLGGALAASFICGTITGYGIAARTTLKTALARIAEQKEDFEELLELERESCNRQLADLRHDRDTDRARIQQLEAILLVEGVGHRRQVEQQRESIKRIVPDEMADRIIELDKHPSTRGPGE